MVVTRKGGYYRCKNGQTAGPIKLVERDSSGKHCWGGPVDGSYWYGRWNSAGQYISGNNEHPLNLVEEIPAPDAEESPITTRTHILESARKCVSGDRNIQYGSPEDNFKIIAAYWDVFLGNRKPGALRAEEVAQMMVLLKTARLQANPTDLDGWVDIAGYAACGGEVAGATE